MLKKLVPLTLLVCIALFLVACGGKADDAKDPPGSSGTVDGVKTVAFLMPHLDNPFMNRLSDAVKKYAKEAGFELTASLANNDAAVQSQQIKDAIEEGVDAIILDPCSNEELADAVAEAKKAGIPVITLHESISTQQDCVSFTGPDFTDGGKQAMSQAMKDLPDGGNIAIVYGIKGHSAQIAISAGYPEALAADKDKYPVVVEGYGNWVTDDAKLLVSGWLEEGKKLDAIVCNNDGMAAGALEAVSAADLAGKINIYGLDAQENILDAIKEGTVKATIYTDFDAEAKKSVEIAGSVLSGENVDAEYLLPMILITSENVDEYIK